MSGKNSIACGFAAALALAATTVAPVTAFASYQLAPPNRDHVYNDIEICSGKLEGTGRTQRLEACSAIINYSRLEGKSLGAILETRAILYQTHNDLKLALADYNRAAVLDPGRAEILINRGACHLANGQADDAIADYAQALALQPDSFWAHYNRAVIYSFTKKDYHAALTDLDAALKIDPGYAPAYSARGMVNSRLGSFRQAIADHDKAIRLRPTSATTYEMRAATYLSRKDYSHAIADYAHAHELAPNRALALFGLGMAEFKSGRIEQGQAEMAAAKKLKPDIERDFANGEAAIE